MAKVNKSKQPKSEKPTALDRLVMRLFAPGMSLLHRAGLGGLACTLKKIEQQYASGLLPEAKLPAPFPDGQPPWEIDEQTVTLKFGKPERASEYLRKLFEFAFQIKDGLIYLPGQYGDVPPSLVVLAAIQDGIQNTFLQHGPTCGSRESERTVSVEIDSTPVTITHDAFTSYKHQGWFWLDRDEKSKEKDLTTGKKLKTGGRIQLHQSLPVVHDDGTLSGEIHEVDNKLFPGGIVRHDRFDESAVRETTAELICLHFSLIGCLTLSVNRVTAVLIVPEVQDLLAFSQFRPWLTPSSAKDCRIAGAADAALQAQVRIRARLTAETSEIPACYAMTCRPTQWNKKQKPRVATMLVPAGSDRILDRFGRALSWLSPRLIVPPTPTPKEKSRTKKSEQPQPYWVDSIVRPMIAENLAVDRPWYSGFVKLVTGINPATRKPCREQLPYERKGLHAMISDEEMWDTASEQAVVLAVHEALRGRFRDIADIFRDRPQLMKKKFADESNKWGRAFAGAMTADQFRKLLCDLFRRAGQNSELQQRWQQLLPMLRPRTWQHSRDLAIIGICSYQPRKEPEAKSDEAEVK